MLVLDRLFGFRVFELRFRKTQRFFFLCLLFNWILFWGVAFRGLGIGNNIIFIRLTVTSGISIFARFLRLNDLLFIRNQVYNLHFVRFASFLKSMRNRNIGLPRHSFPNHLWLLHSFRLYPHHASRIIESRQVDLGLWVPGKLALQRHNWNRLAKELIGGSRVAASELNVRVGDGEAHESVHVIGGHRHCNFLLKK